LLALLLAVGLSGRMRAGLIGGALALSTLVAATRVLLPVHYLSDVIAGSAVGLAVAAASLLTRAAFVRRR
jgi:membrane-associated phospholipid phosphatase